MKIAIIGSGISGLTAAWLLHEHHEIDVFEGGDHIGGHTNTVPIALGGRTWPVDTGFIVFNRRTYPTFCRVLDRLGVASRDTTMSFSVRDEATGLEWNGTSLSSVFAQRRNLLSLRHWGMLRDILRFAPAAEALAVGDDTSERSLDEFLASLGLGEAFRRHYLTPMTSAIWSMPPDEIGRFPARFLCRFLHNHGMLRVSGRPQWRTVVGGSWSYVQALTAPFRSRIHLGRAVAQVRRLGQGVAVQLADGTSQTYDQVILACHADQALRLVDAPTAAEQAVLADLPYSSSVAVLHTDERLLPRTRAARAAWNSLMRRDAGAGTRASLTYDMTELQGLHAPARFLVSLGCDDLIDPDTVLRRIPYQHPCYALRSIAAQRRWGEISGVDRLHYCGAYWGWGFHEDGCVSGIRVAQALGATWTQG